jgi:hypothetical protein
MKIKLIPMVGSILFAANLSDQGTQDEDEGRMDAKFAR